MDNPHETLQGGESNLHAMYYSFSDGNILISEINPFLSTSQLDISLELPVTSSHLPVPDYTGNMNLPTGQIKLQKFSGYPTEYPDVSCQISVHIALSIVSSMVIPESLRPSSFT